jgi:hypothetical protein
LLYLKSHALHGFLLFEGVDYGVSKFNEFFSPLGELLFFACTKQRLFYKKTPGCFVNDSISPFRRPFFLMLVHKKEGKEQDTPASAFILCYSAWRASIETRPDKPHRTWLVAELGQPMAEDSRQPCVARRGRWGPRTPIECHRM